MVPEILGMKQKRRALKMSYHRVFMKEALGEARKGLEEGGIPIGSVLVRKGRSSEGAGTGGSRMTPPLPMPRSNASAVVAG
jgi:hypothetical protein